ncbi:MAG: DUF1800 family protein [Planctomycetes bacterium]|nr:DUF1800 family protein [Planctomycetota bacterium]
MKTILLYRSRGPRAGHAARGGGLEFVPRAARCLTIAAILASAPSLVRGQPADPLDAARAAVDAARQAKADAEKALAEAKDRIAKATADAAAAEKAVQEKAEAERKAVEAFASQETFAADKALVEAKNAVPKAEQAFREAEAALAKAAKDLEGAKAARDDAAAKKAAAEKGLADAPEAEKANAEKTLNDKKASLDGAEQAMQAAQQAADKATQEKDAKAEQRNAARDALLKARERAGQAKAAAIGGLKPLAAGAWTYEKARHLLARAGFAGPPEEIARLYEMGLYAAVDELVDYHLQPEPAGWFDAFPHLRTAPWERHLNEAQRAELDQSRVSFRWEQHHRLRRAWLQRMVETKRPLQEKLALFWHGHFACSYLAAEDSYSMWQQNEMFRRRASGNFGALLHGIAHDPAMIRYLDNHVNFKGSGNENLGREILELFSMGEGKGYTEQDLAEAARALTGYNFEYHNGQFKFIASRHDTNEKVIFGKKGNFGGDELVDLILQQPPTSRYITRKLFRYFAHDNPDPAVIETMSSVLIAHQYELQPMLRNFFCSEEFFSERSMGTHIKSPVELIVSAARTLKLERVDYNAIDATVSDMGQRLFEPPNVAGWEGGRAWIDASSLLLRYNALANLVEQADIVSGLQSTGLSDPAAIVDYLARAYLNVPLSDPKRQELISHLGALPPPDQWANQRGEINTKLRVVLVALVSLPEHQLAQSLFQSDSTLARLDDSPR